MDSKLRPTSSSFISPEGADGPAPGNDNSSLVFDDGTSTILVESDLVSVSKGTPGPEGTTETSGLVSSAAAATSNPLLSHRTRNPNGIEGASLLQELERVPRLENAAAQTDAVEVITTPLRPRLTKLSEGFSGFYTGVERLADIEGVKDLTHLLKPEMKNRKTLPFDLFLLGMAGGRSNFQEAQTLANTILTESFVRVEAGEQKLFTLGTLADIYFKKVDEKCQERSLYGPLEQLLNQILTNAERHQPCDFPLQVHDTHDISFSSGRYFAMAPDLVFLPASHPWSEVQGSLTRRSKHKLSWKELFGIIEVKVDDSPANKARSTGKGRARTSALQAHPSDEVSNSTSTDASGSEMYITTISDHGSFEGTPISGGSETRKRVAREEDDFGDGQGRDIKRAKEIEHTKKKEKEPVPRDSLVQQGCRYAIEQISSGLDKRHVFQIFVVGSELSICYYDRVGICVSYFKNFREDLSALVLFIVIMQRWAAACLSVDCVSRVDEENFDRSNSSAILPKEHTSPWSVWEIEAVDYALSIQVGERLSSHMPYGLIGRGSFVCKGIVRKDNTCCVEVPENKLIAVKTSWPNASRISERTALDLARFELQKLDEMSLKWKAKAKNRIIGKLGDALPVCYVEMDLDNLKENGFRAAIIKLLADEPENAEKWKRTAGAFTAGLDFRIWRLLLFEILHPVYEIPAKGEFKKCLREIFQVLHWLWTKNIQHRDVSVGNLMFRRNPDGSMQGVLNDWDLCKIPRLAPEGQPISRTGTRPFMAIDALETDVAVHLERFDWESFMWTILWIAGRFTPGSRTENKNAFKSWLVSENSVLKQAKSSILMDYSLVLNRIKFQGFYSQIYLEWLLPLLRVFRRVRFRRAEAIDIWLLQEGGDISNFNEDSIDGKVTYDELWTILLL